MSAPCFPARIDHAEGNTERDARSAVHRRTAADAGATAPDTVAPPAGAEQLLSRTDAAARARLVMQLQRIQGNQSVQRLLAHVGIGRDPAPAVADAPPVAAPTANYEVPFDHSPLSSPGEQVIFNDQYDHATPGLFQLKYTATGGSFDAAGGPTTKTIPGLASGNLMFFIDAAWDGKSAVSVRLDIQLVADSSVKYTTSWTFGKKVKIPTTISQIESETAEFAIPGVFSYIVGPHTAGTDSYLHQTILESFTARTSNLVMDDLTDAFKTAHPAITTPQQITDFFFGTSSGNGTFTVDTGDKIADQHGGMLIVADSVLIGALKTPKDVWVDLPQTYSIGPGAALGKFKIHRIRKTDGTKVVVKSKI